MLSTSNNQNTLIITVCHDWNDHRSFRVQLFFIAHTYFLFALLNLITKISHAFYDTGSLDNLGSPLSGNISDTNATAKIEVCLAD